MSLLSPILFWTGIVLLVDGSLGLLLLEKWQEMAKGLDIQRIAWIEIGVALGLLGLHGLLL